MKKILDKDLVNDCKIIASLELMYLSSMEFTKMKEDNLLKVKATILSQTPWSEKTTNFIKNCYTQLIKFNLMNMLQFLKNTITAFGSVEVYLESENRIKELNKQILVIEKHLTNFDSIEEESYSEFVINLMQDKDVNKDTKQLIRDIFNQESVEGVFTTSSEFEYIASDKNTYIKIINALKDKINKLMEVDL